MIITEEPPYGFILAGRTPNQVVYERYELATPERWYCVGDFADCYTFEDMLADYKVLQWLILSPLSAATSAT